MERFNLAAAMAGANVCTRDGRAVRIVCFDSDSTICHIQLPILALVKSTEGSNKYVVQYTIDGKLLSTGRENNADLMMVSVHHEGWTNVFKNKYGSYLGGLCPNKEAAERAGSANANYVKSIKVEWDE